MFEAGALSKKADSARVCPILFGVDTIDLEGPLVQFQSSLFNETEIRKLIKTINSALGENKLEDTVLNNVFEKWWPDLNERVGKIVKKHKEIKEEPSKRPEREILEEILKLTRLSASSNYHSLDRSIDFNALKRISNIILESVDSLDKGDSPNKTRNILLNVVKPLLIILYDSDPQTDDIQSVVDIDTQFMALMDHGKKLTPRKPI